MDRLIQSVLNSQEKIALQELIGALTSTTKRYFLRNEILQAFSSYCQQSQKPAYFYHSSSLGQLIQYTDELILEDESVWLLIRPWIGNQQVWRLPSDLSHAELRTRKALLEARDRYMHKDQDQILEIDFAPFYKGSPSISDPRNIGQGLVFLNHYLCDQILADRKYWLEALFNVLQRHQHDGVPLLINDRIRSGDYLCQQIEQALKLVSQLDPQEPYAEFHADFQKLGFEPGWGNTAAHVCETLELLDRLIENPEPAILEAFVSRIPTVFRVVLISIHGWVGQESVLGRPETSGQVAYVLDQARSLETRLQGDVKLAGLDFLGIQPQVIILTRLIPNCEGTQCNLPFEKVDDTENAWILRVPFREFNPNVTQNWISKFEIWPYLESFALDAEKQLLTRLGGPPNLVIGNYTDGNLVAYLLARRIRTIHCNIAHSLEKPKRLFSNLYWQELEQQYHFSAQFTADLINMNAADFIITSSYQEIMGTPETVGQYESYSFYTMPHLYHVLNGINLFSPKFNRVPPGVNGKTFFPYTQTDDRDRGDRQRIYDLLFEREAPHIYGRLENPGKRPILAVATMNVIKNLTGLVECFGRSQELQSRCNLILLTNNIDPGETANSDEAGEIERLHQMIKRYQLQGGIRWIGMRLSTSDLGEAYRTIADARGIFVQYARFEAFGRVILEAMASGLPTFATQFGGALEIIEDGKNGFLINPTDQEGTAEKIVHFFDQYHTDVYHWEDISRQAIQRVNDEYNWQLHTQKLLLLAKLYSFWNYVNRDQREALSQYLEALFFLLFKPRADLILEEHSHR
jgi:sucrose synthase